jgi:hypothetical protein
MNHGTEGDPMMKAQQGPALVGIQLHLIPDGAPRAKAKFGKALELSDKMLPGLHGVGPRTTGINGKAAIKSTGMYRAELPEPLHFW